MPALNGARVDRFGARRPPVLGTVLVKPTGPDCNLDCEYCSYLAKSALFPESKVHRMSDAVLEALTRKLLAVSAPTTSVVWQGGEPTMMGLSFFERAVALQKQYKRPDQIVTNSLQTNGLLLDERWVEFLLRNRFLVGLSIDGAREMHDRYRLNRGGQPSWDDVVRSARLLLDAGVATNVLSVVTGPLAHTGAERYRALRELGFEYLQFIPCVERDPANPDQLAPFSVSGEQYGHFLRDVFACWRDDLERGEQVFVRNFDAILHTYVGVPAPDCTLLATCGVYLTVEHNGDIFPCDFYVEIPWRLGNVCDDNLQALFASERMDAFGGQKCELAAECRSCKWLNHCFGGCPKDRWRGNAPGHLCAASKVFLSHAHEDFKRLAKRVKRRWEREREAASRKRK